MYKNLLGKRILITAGPTWVSIDKVRVISNISSGKTGMLLAKAAKRAGAKLTLFLGPISTSSLNHTIRVIQFKYFQELRQLLKKELKRRNYDIIIHCAAVSDFRLKRSFKGKIKSDKENLKLTLEPTPKIIKEIRRYNPKAYLVMFKLELNAFKKSLIGKVYKAMKKVGVDLAVANRLEPYEAFIIDQGKKVVKVKTKEELSRKLLKIIAKHL